MKKLKQRIGRIRNQFQVCLIQKCLLLKLMLFCSFCILGRTLNLKSEALVSILFSVFTSWLTLGKSVYQTGLYFPIWQMSWWLQKSPGTQWFYDCRYLGLGSGVQFFFNIVRCKSIFWWEMCFRSQQGFQLQMQNKGEGVVCGCDEEFPAARYLENGEICTESILLVVENND